MGLFGFVGNIASAAVKVVATPVAAVVDVASVSVGIEATNTKRVIESVGEDLSNAGDEIMP